MNIDSGYIYRHDDHDEILVLGVQHRYDTYDTETQTGTEAGIYVQYATDWDRYGATVGATRFEPIDDFRKAAGEKHRQFDRISLDSSDN